MAKTETVEIRRATREDLPAISGIYNWAVNQTFATIDSEPLDIEEAAHWWDTHAGRDLMLVAVVEGGVVGWGRLMPWKQRGFDIVEDRVYVDPVHHGQGIGSRLLEQLIEAASEMGDVRTIVTTVATDNRDGLALHQKHGFKPVGTIRDGAYKFDRWMDITLLQRPLA